MNLNTNPTSHDYIDRMWDGRGFGLRREDDILTAHGMVQTFVNAFARDGVYKVHFDPNTLTAGTEYKTRRVVITPAPILDTDLTPVEAGRILTGLAVHEISHPRFGKHTHAASRKVWPNSPVAHKLQNLLDDVRIERRFAEQYPGYAHVFEPTLDYVGRGSVARNGGKKITARMDDPLNLAIMAVRYPQFADFSGVESELAWWTDWAVRYTANDTSKLFVAGIRAALKHIADSKNAPKPEPKQTDAGGSQSSTDEPEDAQPEPQSGGSDQTGQDEDQTDASSSDEDDTSTDEDATSDDSSDDDERIDAGSAGDSGEASQDTGEETDERSDDDIAREADDVASRNAIPREQAPACAGRAAVEQAARNAGVDRDDIRDAKDQAEQVIEAAEYYEDDGLGGRIDVARSMRGLNRDGYNGEYRRRFVRSDAAARAIREAIARSRTGHTDVATYQKRGRIDNRGLHRIAQNDSRIFSRRSAASPGKFLIWMMLDRSSSMDGEASVQSAQVATAIADATRHLPTVRAAVWAWSNSFRGQYGYGGSAGVALAWKSGQSTDEIAKTVDLRSGGTPDAETLSWAWRAIRKEATGGEQPVILMCSDGFGSSEMSEIVADARAHGVIVKSIAIGSISDKDQEARYGPEGYVPWAGSIIATARPLARMIAKMVGRDARARSRG